MWFSVKYMKHGIMLPALQRERKGISLYDRA